jgi:transcription factor IIIB subunit 2
MLLLVINNNIEALYFGFRCKNAPYLLIEISEKIEHCSAISIGRCYLKLLEFVKGDSKNPKIEQLA